MRPILSGNTAEPLRFEVDRVDYDKDTDEN